MFRALRNSAERLASEGAIQRIMDIESFKDGAVHFIGCGGAGTQPLMKIFHELGFKVSGSDLQRSAATDALLGLGLDVRIGHSVANLPPEGAKSVLVVHSSAAVAGNPELDEAKRRSWPCLRRGEALALLASGFKRSVAVSGSHGKTSVTAMIAHILKELGMNPGYMVGGKVCGWGFNGAAGSGDLFVTEVDESDGTHSLVKASLGVVTNVEDDHAWSVGGVEALMGNFKRFAFQSGHLIYVGSPACERLFAGHPSATRLDWAEASASRRMKGVDLETIASWGPYQRVNGAQAVEAAVRLGADRLLAEKALSSYPGVDRRMSLRYDDGSVKMIEDYAHHPTELAASLSALEETNPGRRLVVVFQPHRYARLEMYIDLFAKELKRAGRVFVTPVFAAWTASGKLDSKELARRIGPCARAIEGSWEAMAAEVLSELRPGDLVAVIGAGDLKEILPRLEKGLSLAGKP